LPIGNPLPRSGGVRVAGGGYSITLPAHDTTRKAKQSQPKRDLGLRCA
jgi:hypothetical protein